MIVARSEESGRELTPQAAAELLDYHTARWRAAAAAEQRILGRTGWLARLPDSEARAVTHLGPLAAPAGFGHVGGRRGPVLASSAAAAAALTWLTPEAHLRDLRRMAESNGDEFSPDGCNLEQLGGQMFCVVGCLFGICGAAATLHATLRGAGDVEAQQEILCRSLGFGLAGLLLVTMGCAFLRTQSPHERAGTLLRARQRRLTALDMAATARREAEQGLIRAARALSDGTVRTP